MFNTLIKLGFLLIRARAESVNGQDITLFILSGELNFPFLDLR